MTGLPWIQRPFTPPDQVTVILPPTTALRIQVLAEKLKKNELTERERIEFADLAQHTVAARDINKKQAEDILEANRNRRRAKAKRQGIHAKVMTVDQIEKERLEKERKANEQNSKKEERRLQAERSRFQRHVWSELPISYALIEALKRD